MKFHTIKKNKILFRKINFGIKKYNLKTNFENQNSKISENRFPKF